MNQQERDLIAEKLLNLAFFYGKNDLTKNIIIQLIDGLDYFYCKDFKTYTKALDSYSKDKNNRFFPTLAQLRPYIEGFKSDPRQESLEIAQKCFNAITTFGYTKPNQAKEFIGPVGWNMIKQRGGWQWFCETTMIKDIPNLVAQMRDGLVSSVIKYRDHDEGNLDQIEYPINFGSLLKDIPK